MKKIWQKTITLLWILGLFIVSQLGTVAMGRVAYGGEFSLASIVAILGISLGILILFIFLARKEKLADFNFSFFGWKSLGSLVLAFVVARIFSIIGFLVLTLERATNTENQAIIEQLFSQVPVVVMFFFIVILAPVTEEIIFRGYIPNKLFKGHEKWGYVFGVILFAFAHGVTNFGTFIIYGSLGAILAFLAYRSKHLEMSILFHVLNNLLAFIVMFLTL